MAQTTDRSAYKATSVQASIEADERLAVTIGKNDDNILWHSIKDGQNYFRILPPHVDHGSLYGFPKVVCRLPILADELDNDRNKTGRKIMISKQIFNSKVHGSTTKDLVDEYITLVKEKARKLYPNNKSGQDDYLKPVRGSFSKVKELNIQGIEYKETWIAYAVKLVGDKKVFGKLEYGRAIKNRLGDITTSDVENDPLGLDPFTDLDEGRAVKVLYNSKADKPQDYYKVEIYAPSIPGTGGQVKLFPIDDETFNKYVAAEPLETIYSNSFKRRDFELQIEGLKNFDNKYRFEVMAMPEFLDILEELNEVYPFIPEVNPNSVGDVDLPFGEPTTQEKVPQPRPKPASPLKLETPVVPQKLTQQAEPEPFFGETFEEELVNEDELSGINDFGEDHQISSYGRTFKEEPTNDSEEDDQILGYDEPSQMPRQEAVLSQAALKPTAVKPAAQEPTLQASKAVEGETAAEKRVREIQEKWATKA